MKAKGNRRQYKSLKKTQKEIMSKGVHARKGRGTNKPATGCLKWGKVGGRGIARQKSYLKMPPIGEEREKKGLREKKFHTSLISRKKESPQMKKGKLNFEGQPQTRGWGDKSRRKDINRDQGTVKGQKQPGERNGFIKHMTARDLNHSSSGLRFETVARRREKEQETTK